MAYKQRWISFFKLLDGNKNNFIDKNDADFVVKKFFSGDKFTAAQQKNFKLAFQTWIDGVLEAEGKKRVNLEQWLSGVEKSLVGKSLEDSPAFLKKGADAFFDAVDENKNGVIGENEFIVLLTGMVPAAPVELVRMAFKTIKTKLNREVAHEACWSWFTGPERMVQDNILDLAVLIL